LRPALNCVVLRHNFSDIKEREVETVGEIIAPMAGKVIDVRVKVGDQVSDGDEVVVIEAMKMEIPVVAPESGTVAEITCREGDAVEADGMLVKLS